MDLFEIWATAASGRHGGLTDSSKKMYSSMWGKLRRYLGEQGADPATCGTPVLEAFLSTLASPSSAMRYARLMEAVFAHRGEFNPAAGLSTRLERPRRPVPTAVNVDQAEKLLSIEPTSWLSIRDLALAAVALGSGAKPGELATLTVTDIHLDEIPPFFTVATHGRVRAVPLAPVAREPLKAWMAVRQMGRLPDGPVFCSGSGAALSPSALWRACARVFKAADVEARHIGGQSLRNAFAIRQLRLGKPVTVVRDWLGHKQTESTLVFKRLIVNPGGIEAE
jgi:integrase